jgi:hypothetical protein
LFVYIFLGRFKWNFFSGWPGKKNECASRGQAGVEPTKHRFVGSASLGELLELLTSQELDSRRPKMVQQKKKKKKG